MYQRKTVDEYQIITNYGYGEEVEVVEYTLQDAKRTKKEYLDNCSNLVSIRIKKKRVPKENK